MTVRTLRYYDEINLLKPSRVSEGNHRYYDEKAVEKLQNIIFLKDLGFDLETIRSILNEKVKSSKELLKLKLEMIVEEQERLEQKKQRIKMLLEVMELEGKNDWETTFETLSMLEGYDYKKLRERWNKYFSQEEQKILKSMPRLGDENPLSKKWMEIMKELKESVHEDPNSPKVQQLVEKWTELLEQMYQGNWNLANKVWQLHYKGNQNLGFYNLDPETMEFIEKVEKYYQKQSNH